MTAFTEVEGSHATELLKDEKVFILDVRTLEEFENDGVIDGACLIPIDEIQQRVSELPHDLEEPIFVYCAHGMRSTHVCHYLVSLGYKKIFNLTGGFCAYQP